MHSAFCYRDYLPTSPSYSLPCAPTIGPAQGLEWVALRISGALILIVALRLCQVPESRESFVLAQLLW